MQRMLQYSSPIGTISIIADEMGLTGLYFDESMPAHQQICDDFQSDSPILDNTKRWLDIYFSGKNPGFSLPLHPAGSPFQQQVWGILANIPYGKTTTYGEIARQVA
ncbi:MAG: methylated-DNA--[protein]-cysteine S-methyltransferase, partial [Bacteroidales bacterium]|nr:methylated-DNA--[protein]-cysteine S-methyltransferase [Bacteroidales bacterium]